ncbi:hypothetical protein GCM10022254_09360 [Actinomadura meridiana]|uniref:Uncharacterized protein n=1 Tax=Actinomadura meridiana TaxID=559626 RepID=A0ABP8BU50_9ACTN
MIIMLERGHPVTVLAKFRLASKLNPSAPCPPWLHWTTPPSGVKRNALVQRANGERVVRPFRGLRRPR